MEEPVYVPFDDRYTPELSPADAARATTALARSAPRPEPRAPAGDIRRTAVVGGACSHLACRPTFGVLFRTEPMLP